MTQRSPVNQPSVCASHDRSHGAAPMALVRHVPIQFTSADRGLRLQKVLAGAGVASRRECEAMIKRGCVTVNGQPITALPAWVDPENDRIAVDGNAVPLGGAAGTIKVLVVLNKPRGVISTSHDPHGRKRVVDLVNLPWRLYPVGRLDAATSGLILMTNDGELAHRLTHPRYEVPKRYHVAVTGRITQQEMTQLKAGLYLAHRTASNRPRHIKKAGVAHVKLIGYSAKSGRAGRSRLALTLREGQNRQIRRLLARLGHKVHRLHRVAIGPINIKGLALGQWRMLNTSEGRMLRRAARLDR